MFPFSAIIGQEDAKLALILAAIDREIGGVLLSGVKGTGKSSVIRAFVNILPDLEINDGCKFNCLSPTSQSFSNLKRDLCPECKSREDIPSHSKPAQIITVPLSTTEDRLLGSVNMEKALKKGEIDFMPGLLAQANNQVFYIDEVNLLPDHLTDNILDVVASGINTVQREGISVSHPARFTLIGTMNPEEGQLRPQILDRFALSVDIKTIYEMTGRAEIMKRSLAYSQSPEEFEKVFEKSNSKIRKNIQEARTRLKDIKVPTEIINAIALAMGQLKLDGQRPDIVVLRAAIAYAAFRDDRTLAHKHIEKVAAFAICHRTRNGGMDEAPSPEDVLKALSEGFDSAKKQKSKTESLKMDEIAQQVLDSALNAILNTENDSKKKQNIS